MICLQNDNDLEHLLTAFVCTPLVAGNLRKIADDNRKGLAKIVKGLNELIKQGPLTEFHKLRGDRHVAPTEWDGFVRYTRRQTTKRAPLRGLVCLFRNQASVSSLCICIPGQGNDGVFRFSDMQTDAHLGDFAGAQLRTGITVNWLDGLDCRAVAFTELH